MIKYWSPVLVFLLGVNCLPPTDDDGGVASRDKALHDAAADAHTTGDAGVGDNGGEFPDSGTFDATPDGSIPDSTRPDSTRPDGTGLDGFLDASPGADILTADGATADAAIAADSAVVFPDARVPDARVPDARVADAAIADTGIADTGVADTGMTDTGAVPSRLQSMVVPGASVSRGGDYTLRSTIVPVVAPTRSSFGSLSLTHMSQRPIGE